MENPAFIVGDLLPARLLAWFQVQLLADLGGNRRLPPLRNYGHKCIHIGMIACENIMSIRGQVRQRILSRCAHPKKPPRCRSADILVRPCALANPKAHTETHRRTRMSALRRHSVASGGFMAV